MTTRSIIGSALFLFAGCGPRVIGDLGETSAGGTGRAPNQAGSSTAYGGASSSFPTWTRAGASVGGGGAESIGGEQSDGGTEANGGALGDGAGGFGDGAGGFGDGVGGFGDGVGGVSDAGGASGADGREAQGGNGNPDLPPLPEPIAHFKLDECSGGAHDVRSDSLGARFGVGCADGLLGNAAVFSADLGELGPRRIELPNEPRFAFTHELTIAAWVKPDAGPQHRAIVGKWYDMDSFQLAIRDVQVAEGKLSPRFSFSIAEPEGTWGRPSEVISPDEVELGTWTHVAGVYRWSPNGQVGHITLYVNGQAVAETNTKVGTDGLQQSSRPVMIGYLDEGAAFVGLIDEVRLYDVALGPEILRLFLEPAQP